MTHNRYIAIIAGAGFLAFLGFLLVLVKLSPYQSTGLALTLFYITLLIFLTSFFTVVGFYFRLWLFKNEVFYQHINISFRQGLFLTLITIFCLVLQMVRVLTWWSGLLVVVVAVFLEFYFSSKDCEF